MRSLQLIAFCGLVSLSLFGCGGRPEVADAPEAPAPELTPQEEAGERAYTESGEYRGR